MEILLLVATLAVGASGLYVAATFNMRTRRNSAPLIGAVKDISDQIEATAKDLRRELQVIANELQRDRELIELDRSKIQGRLDQADSRISSIASQFSAELDTIKDLDKQIGARQNRFSGDLQQLDHQVARLGESLAQHADETRPPPSAGHADEETSDGVTIDSSLTESGKLYVEILRFSIIRSLPESPSPSEQWVRIQVERNVGELPREQFGDLGDASTIIHRAGHDEGFRGRLSTAASDYFANKVGDPVFAAATERWITKNSFLETAAAEACNNISNGLNLIVERPLEKIGTEIGLPGLEAATAAGIGAGLILQPVTQQLGQAAEFFEIVGVVVGVTAGLHPLALASAKMLVHDEFHHLVARGLEKAAGKVFGKPDQQSPAKDPGLPDVDGPAKPDIPPVPPGPSPSTFWEPRPPDPPYSPGIGGPGLG